MKNMQDNTSTNNKIGILKHKRNKTLILNKNQKQQTKPEFPRFHWIPRNVFEFSEMSVIYNFSEFPFF